MRKIILIVLVIISSPIDLSQALSSQYAILELENDLIYQRIQTSRDLERFYRKLIDGVERNTSEVRIVLGWIGKWDFGSVLDRVMICLMLWKFNRIE